jgi:hypothetical protein
MIEIEHHRIEKGECRQPAEGIAQIEFADTGAAARVQQMRHGLVRKAEARLLEHACEVGFVKVVGDEILLAVP